jgi:hypothetical protein
MSVSQAEHWDLQSEQQQAEWWGYPSEPCLDLMSVTQTGHWGLQSGRPQAVRWESPSEPSWDLPSESQAEHWDLHSGRSQAERWALPSHWEKRKVPPTVWKIRLAPMTGLATVQRKRYRRVERRESYWE